MFVHIPKCAGTSIMGEMARQYRPDRIFRIYGETEERLEALRRLPPDEAAQIRAFGGHLPFGLDPLVAGPLTTFTLLRHPVERIVSHHAFVLRHRETPMQARMVEGVDTLEEYVTRSPAAPLFNNGMVRYLGGDALGAMGPADADQLHTALDRIRDGTILVGLQERYPESLARFARTFGWRRVKPKRANVGADRAATSELPRATVTLIETHNALDLELYEEARAVFAATLAAD